MTFFVRGKLCLGVKCHFADQGNGNMPKFVLSFFFIVLHLFGKQRQNPIRKSPWLKLAGICFQENRSSWGEVA